MEDPFGHHISYLRVSITDRCNERCRYCLPDEQQNWLPRDGILSYEEILRILRVGTSLGIKKVRITGGEPLTRRDVLDFFAELGKIDEIEDIGISTNGTLLGNTDPKTGKTFADSLVASSVRTANISLDTLDPTVYKLNTGRDYLSKALAGIDAAREAGFEKVKLNCVLMKGQNEAQLLPLIEFAHQKNLLLRFIELMPVSSTEMINEDHFFSAGLAKKQIEETLGKLTLRPDVKTNGPATYYEVPKSGQLLGFIGAMTNFHFCDSCNKLRLTCDGKLRPCLGSHLEFDLLSELRKGISDAQLADFFRDVVSKKPKEHDFRNNYEPNRKMIAIGG